ncbi:hypothetical protein [Flavobacterium sp. N2270]|uniref:hypothetical protein n=1 Tax=Flavobacterium sp. N2270 TaxID=2986831 RepID=UPI00222433AA|nr:hypothetical protein [Flavobacterium sp. N2270]
MYKKLSLFFVFLVVSCQYFDAKAPDENVLLQEELKKINWSEVDQYPSIFQCDTIQDVVIQKQCFFDNLIKIIQERIGIDTIQMMYPKVDTIDVKVTINADSTLKFEAQQPKDSITYDFVKIDSILKNRLSDFPKVEPAIKRGIKVKTQFVVPVIIKVTE